MTTDNKALADRLRTLSVAIGSAGLTRRNASDEKRWSGEIDAIATALTATPSAQAGEVPRYGRWHPVHGFEWSRAYETGGYPDKEWTTLCTTPQPQGDASPQVSGGGEWRSFRDESFTEARAQLVHVLKAQKSWLTGYAEAYVDDFAAALTPRAHEPYRDAYEGAREDLLDWKGRAQRAEARLRSLGWKGIDASEPGEPAPTGDGGEESAFDAWFLGEQGTPYDGMRQFARAAWMHRATHLAPQADVARQEKK